MKDHEVTREQPLLDESGRIAEPGWARRQIWKYDREKIRASAFRIRERDRYVVMGDEFGAVFTLADNGYFGLQSVSLADFRDKRDHTETMLSLFPMGKMKMPPSSSQGDVIWKDKRLRMEFRPDAGRRKILCDMKEFWQGKPFYCEITLEQPESDSIVTAASRRGGKTFCYEQKINCMRAEGYLSFADRTYWFDPEKDYGTLAWERSVTPWGGRRYWSSGSGTVGGKPFGFNIGSGPGDETGVCENMIFYDGIGHKIGGVEISASENDRMRPWTFMSGDGRFEMEFEPVMELSARRYAAVPSSGQRAVFGRMKGRAVLDDGRFIELKDFMCFAQKSA